MRKIIFGIMAVLIAVSCADKGVIYQTETYLWNKESVSSQENVAQAESEYKINTTALSKDGSPRAWECRNDVSRHGVFTGISVLETALYNMAVDEMINAVEEDGTLRTGALWKGVWTRDVSYSTILSMSYMLPQNVRNSLEVKIDRLGRIIQDTGTGGSWPCSSDRVIWAVAAWKLYVATGDMDWLKKVYPVILTSLESDAQALYDPETGLYKGESSFIDWRSQSYPTWMRAIDIYNSECLGTNVVYSEVLRTVARMAEILGDEDTAKEYQDRAANLTEAINKAFWMPEKGFYGSYLYGKNGLYLCKRSETLGESLAVLWGVADKDKASRLMSDMPVSPWGPTIFWPQIESQIDYHNNAVWPFVTSYWGLAAIKADNSTAFLHAMASNVRLAALYATNYENFTSSTGNPYTTSKNSHNMLWSLSGFIGLYHRAFFGFEFREDGLSFSPYVPKELKGERSLMGFPYRNMKLNISVSGYGDEVKEFVLDWCYSNGHWNEKSSNKCSVRTLYVDGIEKGVSVFPQLAKDDWEITGWSNAVKMNLAAGSHTVQLMYLDTNVNMNKDTDYAIVRDFRITRCL